MGLDIRIPMGLMFGILGVILTIFGLVSDRAIYQKHSLGININLWWGLVLMVFAGIMLLLAWRGSKTHPEGSQTPAQGTGTRRTH